MELIAELKRRKVAQWALGYAAGAWALLQAIGFMVESYDWSHTVSRIAIVVVAIGFLVTLVLAWYHGERGEQRLSRNEMLLLAVLLALGGGLLWRTGHAPELVSLSVVPAKPVKAVGAVNPKSIAVLPFVNMSGEAENEFFSDGLSEEILNSLARIDGMQVVGRTSSFQFKGKNEDLRIIGEKLGVATVLEGSVRREGERARITAQLIRASDGIHLWSQTYDRTLKDTLAVQLDIAEQVAGALDVVLDDRQRNRMREAGVKNVDAFIAYQKGLKLYDAAHDPDRSADLIATLRLANVEFAKATALEPDFTLAHFAATDLFEHLMLSDDTPQPQRIESRRAALAGLNLAYASSRNQQERLFIAVDRQVLSDDWHGLAGRIDAALAEKGCRQPDWLPQFSDVFGYAARFEDLGASITACDPLNLSFYLRRAEAANWAGDPKRTLDIIAQGEHAMGGSSSLTLQRIRALLALGRIDDARNLVSSLEPSGELFAIAQLLVGRAGGDSAAVIHARLMVLDRSHTRFHVWSVADSVEVALAGNRREANRRAAEFDARPGGGLQLALFTGLCQCGAPFDLDATPNFRARLTESGLRWPPPATIKYPPRPPESKP